MIISITYRSMKGFPLFYLYIDLIYFLTEYIIDYLLSYFFKYTITLRYGSSPSLFVATYLSFCNVEWIILLS